MPPIATKVPEIFAKTIKEVRRQTALGQKEPGLSFSTINRWENDRAEASPPAMEKIESLLCSLGNKGEALPDSADRAKAIIDAMESIEAANENLRGVLPKSEYQELDNAVLGQLLRTLNPEELGI